MADDEKEESKSVLAVINEWKAIIGFMVLILGGYFWLDGHYARIEELQEEKCSLSYQIRITKADIEFANVDEEIDLHRVELEGLLQTVNPPEERVAFKKGTIDSLDERLELISSLTQCLLRARIGCSESDAGTEKCYE